MGKRGWRIFFISGLNGHPQVLNAGRLAIYDTSSWRPPTSKQSVLAGSRVFRHFPQFISKIKALSDKALNLLGSNMGDTANFASGSVRGFITKEDKVLLVKEKGEENWETPGGRIRKSDENPIETCKREILEETGYRVNVESLLDVCVHVFEDKKRVFHIIYKCNLKEKVKEPDPDIVDVKWFSRSEIKGLLKQNKADFHDKNVFKSFAKGKFDF